MRPPRRRRRPSDILEMVFLLAFIIVVWAVVYAITR